MPNLKENDLPESVKWLVLWRHNSRIFMTQGNRRIFKEFPCGSSDGVPEARRLDQPMTHCNEHVASGAEWVYSWLIDKSVHCVIHHGFQCHQDE